MGALTFPHADQAEAKKDDAAGALDPLPLLGSGLSLMTSLFVSSSMVSLPSGGFGCSHFT